MHVCQPTTIFSLLLQSMHEMYSMTNDKKINFFLAQTIYTLYTLKNVRFAQIIHTFEIFNHQFTNIVWF